MTPLLLFLVFRLCLLQYLPECFHYRKDFDVRNTMSGTFDLQLVVDTAQLISDSYITDCSNLRFRRRDDTDTEIWLDFYYESSCNRADTRIWVTPTFTGSDITIEMYFGCRLSDGRPSIPPLTYGVEVTWGDPSGSFGLLSYDSCSGLGLNTFPGVSNKMLRVVSGANGETFAGALSVGHSHSAIGMSGTPTGNDNAEDTSPCGGQAATTSHQHNLNTLTIDAPTVADSYLPSYHELHLCTSSLLDIGVGVVYAVNVTDFGSLTYPLSLNSYSELNDRLVSVDSSSAGGSGGSATHTHSIHGEVGASTSDTCVDLSTTATDCGEDHGHDVLGQDLSDVDNFPTFTPVVFVTITSSFSSVPVHLDTSAIFFYLNLGGPLSLPPKGFRAFSDWHNTYLRGSVVRGPAVPPATSNHRHSGPVVLEDTCTTISIQGGSSSSVFIDDPHDHPSASVLTDLTGYTGIKEDLPRIEVSMMRYVETFEMGGIVESELVLLYEEEEPGNSVVGPVLGATFGVLALVVIVIVVIVVIVVFVVMKKRRELEQGRGRAITSGSGSLSSGVSAGSHLGGGSTVEMHPKPKRKTNPKKSSTQATQPQGPGSSLSASMRVEDELFRIDSSDVELLSEISSGGGGAVVYKSKWQGQIVAYKLWKRNVDGSSEVEEFEREVTLASSLKHPNVCSFYGCVLDGKLGIVMEFCSNGELSSFLQKRTAVGSTVPMGRKLRILHGVSLGMKYLHSKNTIHRDLKPNNVLLDALLVPKLVDFGISRMIAHSRRMTVRIGTSGYMAPEIVLGHEYGSSVDVFSFSVFMYEVLVENWEPYPNADLVSLDFKIANNPAYRPDVASAGLHAPLTRLIVSCWAHDPDLRPSFSSIAESLGTFLSLPQFQVAEVTPFFSTPAAANRAVTLPHHQPGKQPPPPPDHSGSHSFTHSRAMYLHQQQQYQQQQQRDQQLSHARSSSYGKEYGPRPPSLLFQPPTSDQPPAQPPPQPRAPSLQFQPPPSDGNLRAQSQQYRKPVVPPNPNRNRGRGRGRGRGHGRGRGRGHLNRQSAGSARRAPPPPGGHRRQ